jgi:nucleotide-binding universal stress UspA family protein
MLKNRFKKILVALDGSMHSRRGMNEAVSLARQSNGSITGIYILPDIQIGRTVTLSYRKILSKKSKKFMSEGKISAARHGIEFEDKVITSNDIVNTITNFAKSNKFDIIIIGARGESYPKAQFLGSVSNGILNSSNLPILVC